MVIKKIFNSKSTPFLGVDFSGSTLRIVQLEKNKQEFEVLGWVQKKIPKGIIDQAKIIKKDDFIEIFKEAVEGVNGSFTSSDMKLTVPEEKVFTQLITVPFSEDEKELQETIRWETEASIPVALADIYYDWQIINKDKKNVNILVMAISREIIDNYLDVFDRLGFKVIAIEPESLSMARSLIKGKQGGYSLLIDIGTNSSNFAICKKNIPIFTSNSSISGRMMTELVVKALGISFEKAERYKVKRGLEQQLVAGKKTKNIFNPFVTSLFQEVENTFEFLEENLFLEEKNKKIEKIILCGGGSNLKGLSSYLTIKLRQSVTQSNPWINLNFVDKIPPISKQDSQGFAPVIGLSLK